MPCKGVPGGRQLRRSFSIIVEIASSMSNLPTPNMWMSIYSPA